tara:strand:- start:2282 stop:2635 length:354 start_codon:yes stop_codon:yes gene_type:complete
MLTKEQWKNLARFAGITIEEDGVDINGLQWYWSPELVKHWNPEFDWRDFGPLWVKLERWLAHEWELELPIAVHTQINAFYDAEMRGTEQELMQAGCALGATIGATMKPALAADKETP